MSQGKIVNRGCFGAAALFLAALALVVVPGRNQPARAQSGDPALDDAVKLFNAGRQVFRFDTFGDEAFWGDQLKLHQAIAGAKFGGVGPGLGLGGASRLGLKVDTNALPQSLRDQLKANQVDVIDPANTLALLKLNAILGLTGFFDTAGQIQSVGIQCALCHSTVDDALAAGIGNRLDGWPNRDLNVGAIIALAPDLRPFSEALGADPDSVRRVLMTWGPGKFDAALILDGKIFNPDTGGSSATLIPPAFGMAGVNLHTWTGFGGVAHWNAFVANIEMHGQGRFFDPRLNSFPTAARLGLADIRIDPERDRITKQLPALHFYQLGLRAPKPPDDSFDKAAAGRGEAIFTGKAGCNTCHVKPLFTEPGWNMHAAREMCIDDFQAARSPDNRYRTPPLAGLFTHQKGGFYHDGRFPRLRDLVDHYDRCFSLRLTERERADLIQYLLSL